jgi:Zn-dependent protease with chaperone function
VKQAGRAARAGPWLVFALFLACFVPLALPRAVSAAPAPSYADLRVSAIPASDLLTRDPNALVDPRRQESSHHLRLRTRPLFALWILVQSIGLIVLWRRGAAARLRDALSGLKSVHAIRFAFAFVTAWIVSLLALPAAFVIFRLNIEFGVASGHGSDWLRDLALATTLEATLAGAFVVAIFWLVDRSRLWYVYAAVGALASALLFSALEPVLVAPLFRSAVPLPASNPSAGRLTALARAAGVAEAPLLVADLSRRTPIASARAEGFGPTARIVIGDTLLGVATREEIAFVVTREFVHAAQGDVWRTALFRGLFFVVCAALAVLISDRVGFRRDDDPLVRIALSFGILGAILFVAIPFAHAYSRSVEASVDRQALALSRDPAAAVRAFIRLADEGLAPVCPSRFVRLYYYESPPVGSRIAAATGRPDPCP